MAYRLSDVSMTESCVSSCGNPITIANVAPLLASFPQSIHAAAGCQSPQIALPTLTNPAVTIPSTLSKLGNASPPILDTISKASTPLPQTAMDPSPFIYSPSPPPSTKISSFQTSQMTSSFSASFSNSYASSAFSSSTTPFSAASPSPNSTNKSSLSTDHLILITTICALVLLALVAIGVLFLTRRRRKERLLAASHPPVEARVLLRGSTTYATQFQEVSREAARGDEERNGIVHDGGAKEGVEGMEEAGGRRFDARGIRWPGEVVLKGEARELWELGLEWEAERVAKREKERVCRNGGECNGHYESHLWKERVE